MSTITPKAQSNTCFLPPALTTETDTDGTYRIYFAGFWDIGTLQEASSLLNTAIRNIDISVVQCIVFNLNSIAKIDSAGILFIHKVLLRSPAPYTLDMPKGIRILYETVASVPLELPKTLPHVPFFLGFLSDIGKWVEERYIFYKKMLIFFGYFLAQFAKSILSPRSFHWTPTVYHMEHMGIRAIPIITLLSFLIGMVLAYMSAAPFRKFGAQIYVVNLLELSILRELGVLLTAIIVAGRTGASCTAEIGSMMSNEEIASMQVMGLNPMDYLVIPRVVALIIMLPVLTVIANASAMTGGMLASWFSLDIVPQSFWSLFIEATTLTTFYLGLSKAPVFAIIITGVGCFYGFQSTGSSDEIGRLTTESVVQSLFLVIVFDALFAVMYSRLGL